MVAGGGIEAENFTLNWRQRDSLGLRVVAHGDL